MGEKDDMGALLGLLESVRKQLLRRMTTLEDRVIERVKALVAVTVVPKGKKGRPLISGRQVEGRTVRGVGAYPVESRPGLRGNPRPVTVAVYELLKEERKPLRASVIAFRLKTKGYKVKSESTIRSAIRGDVERYPFLKDIQALGNGFFWYYPKDKPGRPGKSPFADKEKQKKVMGTVFKPRPKPAKLKGKPFPMPPDVMEQPGPSIEVPPRVVKKKPRKAPPEPKPGVPLTPAQRRRAEVYATIERMLNEFGKLRVYELAKEVKITPAGAGFYLKDLTEAGKLRRMVGAGPNNIYWVRATEGP